MAASYYHSGILVFAFLVTLLLLLLSPSLTLIQGDSTTTSTTLETEGPPSLSSPFQRHLRSLDFPFTYSGVYYSRPPPPLMSDTPPPMGTIAYFDLAHEMTRFRTPPTPDDLIFKKSKPTFTWTKTWGQWPSVELRKRRNFMEGLMFVGSQRDPVHLVVDTHEAKSWVLDHTLKRGPEIFKFRSSASVTLKRDGRADDYIRTPHFSTSLEGTLVNDQFEIGTIHHPRLDFILVVKDEPESLPSMFEHSGVLGLGVVQRAGKERGPDAKLVPKHSTYWERLTQARAMVQKLIFNMFDPNIPLDCGCIDVGASVASTFGNTQSSLELSGRLCDFTFLAPHVPIAPMPYVMDPTTGWASATELTCKAVGKIPAQQAMPAASIAWAAMQKTNGMGVPKPLPKIRPCWCLRSHRLQAQRWLKQIMLMPLWFWETHPIPLQHRRRRLLQLVTEMEEERAHSHRNSSIGASFEETLQAAADARALETVLAEEAVWVEHRLRQRKLLRNATAVHAARRSANREQIHGVDGSDEPAPLDSSVPSVATSPSSSSAPTPPLSLSPLTLDTLLHDPSLLHDLDLDPSKIAQMSDDELDTIIDYAEARRNEMILAQARKELADSGLVLPEYHNSTNTILHPDALMESHSRTTDQAQTKTETGVKINLGLDSSAPPKKRRVLERSRSNPERAAAPVPSKDRPQPPPFEMPAQDFRDQLTIGKVLPIDPTKKLTDPRRIVIPPPASLGPKPYAPTLMEMLPVASFYFWQDGGCYHPGHIDPRYYKGEITWVSTRHSPSNWNIPISDILVDGVSTGVCSQKGGCIGGLSTGSTLIRGAQSKMLPLMEAAPVDPMCVPSRERILTFVLGNGLRVDLDTLDRTQRVSDGSPRAPVRSEHFNSTGADPLDAGQNGAGDWCQSVLSIFTEQDHRDERLIVLGTPFLQKFYTIFDYQESRVGFAQPRHEYYTLNGCVYDGPVLTTSGMEVETEPDRYRWCRAPKSCGGRGDGAPSGVGRVGFAGSGAKGTGYAIPSAQRMSTDFKQTPGQLSSLAAAQRESAPPKKSSTTIARQLIGPAEFARRRRKKQFIRTPASLAINIRKAKHAREARRMARVRKRKAARARARARARAKAKAQKRAEAKAARTAAERRRALKAQRKREKKERKLKEERRKYKKPSEMKSNKRPSRSATHQPPVDVAPPRHAPLPDWTRPIVGPKRLVHHAGRGRGRGRGRHHSGGRGRGEHARQSSSRAAPGQRRGRTRTPTQSPPRRRAIFPSQPRPLTGHRPRVPSIKPPTQTAASSSSSSSSSSSAPSTDHRRPRGADQRGVDTEIVVTQHHQPDENTHVTLPREIKLPIGGAATSTRANAKSSHASDSVVRDALPSASALRAAGMDSAHPTHTASGRPLHEYERNPNRHPDYPFDLDRYAVDDVIADRTSTNDMAQRSVDDSIQNAIDALAGLGFKGGVADGSDNRNNNGAMTVAGGSAVQPKQANMPQVQTQFAQRNPSALLGPNDDPYHLDQHDDILLQKPSSSLPPSSTPSIPTSVVATPADRLEQVKSVMASMQHAREARQQASQHQQQPNPSMIQQSQSHTTATKTTAQSPTTNILKADTFTPKREHIPPEDRAISFMPSWKKLLFRD